MSLTLLLGTSATQKYRFTKPCGRKNISPTGRLPFSTGQSARALQKGNKTTLHLSEDRLRTNVEHSIANEGQSSQKVEHLAEGRLLIMGNFSEKLPQGSRKRRHRGGPHPHPKNWPRRLFEASIAWGKNPKTAVLGCGWGPPRVSCLNATPVVTFWAPGPETAGDNKAKGANGPTFGKIRRAQHADFWIFFISATF